MTVVWARFGVGMVLGRVTSRLWSAPFKFILSLRRTLISMPLPVRHVAKAALTPLLRCLRLMNMACLGS